MPGKFEPGKDRGVPDPFHDCYALWLVVWIFSGFEDSVKRGSKSDIEKTILLNSVSCSPL